MNENTGINYAEPTLQQVAQAAGQGNPVNKVNAEKEVKIAAEPIPEVFEGEKQETPPEQSPLIGADENTLIQLMLAMQKKLDQVTEDRNKDKELIEILKKSVDQNRLDKNTPKENKLSIVRVSSIEGKYITRFTLERNFSDKVNGVLVEDQVVKIYFFDGSSTTLTLSEFSRANKTEEFEVIAKSVIGEPPNAVTVWRVRKGEVILDLDTRILNFPTRLSGQSGEGTPLYDPLNPTQQEISAQ